MVSRECRVSTGVRLTKKEIDYEEKSMKGIYFRPLNNDQGSIMIVGLLMLVALSLTVFMSMESSMLNSKIMRSSRDYRDKLYRSESGLSIAAERHRINWLSAASILFNLANNDADILDQDANINDAGGNQVRVAQYDLARIEDYNDATINGNLAADALTRDFYPLPHIGPPAIGSGNSGKNFEIRRYGIHSRAVDRRDDVSSLSVESGLYKIFNKYI